MSNLPLEVKLVDDVRKCRSCKWFWGEIPPYGDYPLYDWLEDNPEEIRNQHQTTRRVSKKVLRGKSCGTGQVDPGIMHGCRKAPIMTVGINPNLTSFYASTKGATWAYPDFSTNERYAYYYRHHNVYQESVSLDFIRKNISKNDDDRLIAKEDGWIVEASRSLDHRWLLLKVLYKGESKQEELEFSWTHENRFILLFDRSRTPGQGNPTFKKGDIIGAKLKNINNEIIDLYENSTGYYQRYVYVLEKFKELAGSVITDADLSISEDVAQHDMISCASPGWTSYDIPRERITQNCAIDHAYLLKQFVQTRPSVVVVVGGASMEMFVKIFGPFLKDLDYNDEDGNLKETFLLLKETSEKEKFIDIDIDEFKLKTRIVVSPHFSYFTNFSPQCRLSPLAWQAFQKDFPEDSEIIIKEKILRENKWNEMLPFDLDVKYDDKGSVIEVLKSKMSSAGWNVFMAYYYDPIEMMANVLNQEYKAGRLEYDENIKRLKRAEKGCSFCVNSLWKFTEGCPYGKETELSPSTDELENTVHKMIIESKKLNSNES